MNLNVTHLGTGKNREESNVVCNIIVSIYQSDGFVEIRAIIRSEQCVITSYDKERIQCNTVLPFFASNTIVRLANLFPI